MLLKKKKYIYIALDVALPKNEPQRFESFILHCIKSFSFIFGHYCLEIKTVRNFMQVV